MLIILSDVSKIMTVITSISIISHLHDTLRDNTNMSYTCQKKKGKVTNHILLHTCRLGGGIQYAIYENNVSSTYYWSGYEGVKPNRWHLYEMKSSK